MMQSAFLVTTTPRIIPKTALIMQNIAMTDLPVVEERRNLILNVWAQKLILKMSFKYVFIMAHN